jgi:hypothetical protein
MTITAVSRVHDVLEQHPATGEAFIQQGALFRNVPGQLYAVYDPDLTVEAFATRSGVAVDRLLARLVATAEADDGDAPRPGDRPARGVVAGVDLGYTSGYREPSDIEIRSVVSVQTSRGPI